MNDYDKRGLGFEDAGFVALVLLVTLAFVWLALPFFGAILWGVVAAIVFAPVYRMLVFRLGLRRNLAAALTLLLILAVVIVPAILIGVSLVQEATSIFNQLQSGRIDPARSFDDLREALPDWAQHQLAARGLNNFEGLRQTLSAGVGAGLQTIASRALVVGQGALSFIAALGVMLYLTYFLLRDGSTLGARIKAAVPLRPALRDALVEHFVIVVRATMKGTVVVAIVQGFTGGLIFWLLGVEGAPLWGLLMGFLSLVPAVGSAIVWVPVALYLLATGSVWQGLVLMACGVFVIGLIDNILRPILVGQDTRMPDFVVLIATLAGIDLFGLHGFIVGPVIAALFIAVWKIVAEHGTGESLPAGE
ncbi:MAG: AI-2E family transporter [Novosphingobium sp.]|jgi:predicted PurR-regulated permease PerM|nr:AI-2E family transporter [Novosphingobium sp.]